MPNQSQHLSDELLLHFMDRELPARRTRQVMEHLATCPDCRQRQRALEDTSNTLAEIYRSEHPETHSGAETARIQFRYKLAQSQNHPLRFHATRQKLPLHAAIVAALVLICIAMVLHRKRPDFPSGQTLASDRIESVIPDRALTPGAVRPVTVAEVCSASDRDLDPAVPSSVKKEVLREYGVPAEAPSGDFQIDYLVNPQLGGTDDIRNLWPEAYSDSQWNAHAKDRLERRLQQMVCDRSINLEVAQREIATDWIAAYRKYVGG